MAKPGFRLENRDQVLRFEQLLQEYTEKRHQLRIDYPSLVDAYDLCQGREDGGRLFTALLDARLNFVCLWADTHKVGAAWNDNFSKGKLRGGSVLDSPRKFSGKMDIQMGGSSFVLRCRAIWDKVFGIYVLLFAPDRYDKFVQARSRKSAFKRIAGELDTIPNSVAEEALSAARALDDTFRTAEAHGTGRLRKWTFLMEDLTENPQIELLIHWAVVNKAMLELRTRLSRLLGEQE